MPNLMDLLGQIEKLAYSLAVWIILIPKTVVKIFTDPGWVRGYIAKEFSEAKELRFDDYVSPVILLLLCTLVPFLGLKTLPSFGIVYDNLEPYCVVGEECSLSIEADYFTDTYSVLWMFSDRMEVPVDRQAAIYGVVNFTRNADSFSYHLSSTATHLWRDLAYKGVVVEIVDKDLRLVDRIFLYVTVGGSLTGAISTADAEAQQPPQPNRSDISTLLKNNSYLGILFLIPALIFAMMARGFRGKEVSADSLREIFYAQCYYFTPIALYYYLLTYGIRYLTYDLYFLFSFLSVMFWVMFFWFVKVEVNAIAQERGYERKWKAFGIFALTLGFLVLVASWAIRLRETPDLLRIYAYYAVALCVAAVVITSIARLIRNWSEKRKSDKFILPISGVEQEVHNRLE